MESLDFCDEYIAFIRSFNSSLNEKIMTLSENNKSRYPNKVNQNPIIQKMKNEISDMCNSVCKDIDFLFDNLTMTMNCMKNVLKWKSQIIMIPTIIAQAVSEADILNVTNNVECKSKEIGKNKAEKCSTAKVSPMVGGHVISTPTICLNRLTSSFISRTVAPLSPIIEISPEASLSSSSRVTRSSSLSQSRVDQSSDDATPNSSRRQVPRKSTGGSVGVPSHSDLFFTMTGETSTHTHTRSQSSGMDDASPAERQQDIDLCFRLTTETSTSTNNCTQKLVPRRSSDVLWPYTKFKRNSRISLERANGPSREENVGNIMENNEETSILVNNGESSEEMSEIHSCTSQNDLSDINNKSDTDPLEGPSWLFDRPGESSSPVSSPLKYDFVNFKRPGRSSKRFLRRKQNQVEINLEDVEISTSSDNARLGGPDDDQNDNVRENMKSDLISREDACIQSTVCDYQEEIEDCNDSVVSSCHEQSIGRKSISSVSSASKISSNRKNLKNKSLGCGKKSSLRNSIMRGRLKTDNDTNEATTNSSVLPTCSVTLSRICLDKIEENGNSEAKKVKLEENTPKVNPCRTSGRISVTKINKTTPNREQPYVRLKRRAAETCKQNKNWIDKTPADLKRALSKRKKFVRKKK